MANPTVISVPENTWVKVASAVNTGVVLPLISGVFYFQTVRVPAGAAPTNGDYSDAKEFRFDGAIISNSDPIDVYISCKGGDGGVRVGS